VKLLLDQNLSRYLINALADIWPDISHISLHGLERATDKQIWNFAVQQGYCLVSKDNDFLNMGLLHGAPPKVIIVNTGNASTSEIGRHLIFHREVIRIFHENPEESVLIIP